MSEPKRHHYVPQLLIRRFAGSDGYLFAHDSARQDRGIYRIQPADLFVRKHFYAEIDGAGQKDNSVEKDLSQGEGRANLVIDKISASILNKRLPGLSEGERGEWDSFFITQWRRTPAIRERMMETAGSDERVLEVIEEARARFPHQADEVEHLLQDGPARERLSRNAMVRSMRTNLRRAEAALRGRGLMFVSPDNVKKQFVLGSEPVIRLNVRDSTNHLADLTSEIWIPVSPRILVGPSNETAGERLGFIESAIVRVFNEQVSKRSTIIASSSRELIASLRGVS